MSIQPLLADSLQTSQSAGSLPRSADPPASLVSAAPTPLAVEPHSAVFRDVLSRYDVTDITPRDFSELLHELHKGGAISDEQLQQLSLIRIELEQANIDPDDHINLVRFLSEKLEDQTRDLDHVERKSPDGLAINREASLKGTLQQIDWLSRFATVHKNARYGPLDSLV